MATPIEMKQTFDGPFTVEGVIAFYKNPKFFYQPLSIGRSLKQFAVDELRRLFEEMVKFVSTDQKTAFSEADLDRTFLDVTFLSENSLSYLDPACIELLWPIIQGKNMYRFFDGKRITRCARAGLQKLLTLYRYCCRVESIERDTDGVETELADLGEIALDCFSLKDLARKLPMARVEQILEASLPRLPAPELSYLIASGFFDWKMSPEVFRTLPEKSRKVVCKWLFNKRPILSRLEDFISVRPKIAGLFDAVLCCPDEPASWTAKRATQARDASPTRK